MITTTAKNACAARLHMENSSGVMVDISGTSNRAEPNFTKQIGEFQSFESDWVQRLGCKRDARLTVAVIYSTAADEGWKLVKEWWQNYSDDLRRVRVFLPTEEVGADDFDGEFLIESLTVPVDGTQATPVMVNLNLVQSGGFNINTVAT